MLKYEVMAVNGARRLKEGIREAVCGFLRMRAVTRI